MSLNPVDDAFLSTLHGALSEDVLCASQPRYEQEPRGRYHGRIGALALPRGAADVATLVRAASEARVPVVPYGGGTGLVGGQVLPDGPAPLVISLERMQAVRGVFPAENVLIAEAGAILADVQQAAREAGRLFPLSLAAEGSARIGGNLSTNAGGLNVLRYGNARDLCLGLEAVLPSGEIWNGLSRLRKDNTGYDLRNLLIGSEGTLGIITAAALKLSPLPSATGTALVVVPDPGAAVALLSLTRERVGDAVSAFELIHGQGLRFLEEAGLPPRSPFASVPEWAVLIELGVFTQPDPVAELEAIFEQALERDVVRDGVIAQSQAQADALWALRETIPEANRRIGSISSHDISVPISRIPAFIARGAQIVAELGEGLRLNSFGHLGDGNLHFNVFPAKGRQRSDYAGLGPVVQRAVHDLVDAFEGSISAEHGIGRIKADDLQRYGDPVKLAAMRAIKQALDPHGIMNPGAVLPVGE